MILILKHLLIQPVLIKAYIEYLETFTVIIRFIMPTYKFMLMVFKKYVFATSVILFFLTFHLY